MPVKTSLERVQKRSADVWLYWKHLIVSLTQALSKWLSELPMTVQGYASDRHSCANNADTSCSYQLSSVHRVWYHTLSWKRMWDHDWSKSVFTFPQSTSSKAWSKQNLMRASPLNIKHSCCSCEGWSTEQPLHLNSIAWSRKQRTWRAVDWANCSWHSMVDWLVWDASSTYILWSYF